MTPKEKANELINRFLEYSNIECDDDGFPMYSSQIKNATHCAIISVDEILIIESKYMGRLFHEFDHEEDTMYYWQQVKEEIQKL
jgi:hypothetical protein